MKKYFNYIFIFVVCFAFVGNVRGIITNGNINSGDGVSGSLIENATQNDYISVNPLFFTSNDAYHKSLDTTVFVNGEAKTIIKQKDRNRYYDGNYDNKIVVLERSGDKTKCGAGGSSINKALGLCNDDDMPQASYYIVMIPGKIFKGNNSIPIEVTYKDIGRYNGHPINVKATYEVSRYFNVSEHSFTENYHLQNFQGIIVAIPFNFNLLGTGFFHSAYNKVKYEFYYASDNQPIRIPKNKPAQFLFNSLNYYISEANDGHRKAEPGATTKDESIFFSPEMTSRITKYRRVVRGNGTANLSIKGAGVLANGFSYSSAIVPTSEDEFNEGKINENKVVNSGTIWFYGSSVEFFTASSTSGSILRNGNIMFAPSSGTDEEIIPHEYDYSIDMACTNCSSTLKSNKAIYVQDTTDWEAIMNSGSSSCRKANEYFETGIDSGIYCRSEYEIIYPNKDDIITVYTGRFFTLNATDDDYQRVVGTDKFVHNFKPISVTKKMECKGNIGGQKDALINYFLNEGENADNSGGTIKLTYTDNKKKTYDFEDEPLKSKLDGEVSVSNSGDMITLLGKYYFTLPDRFYRYVQKKDAFSIRDYNTIIHDNPANYRDIEISNIPIPFNDHKTGDEVSTTFKYTLPSKSKIIKAIGKSNYFGCPEDVQIDNLYKKAKDKNSNDMLKETACYKLFGSASLTDKCVTNRLSKTINCLNDDYTCNLPVSDSKTPPCDPKKEVCKVCDPTKEICDGDECNPNLKCCEDCVEDFSKVIYRVINVDNPFTYENGKIRNTGINWCSETANDGKIDCSGNNKTVLSKITDKKNISESEALYVIDLTSDNIKSLRGYNENHSYEYYNCDKNVSDFCRSEILSGTSSSARNLVVNGKCRENYKTCTD